MATKTISIGLALGSLVVAGLIILDNPGPVAKKMAAFEIQNSEVLTNIAVNLQNSTEEIAKKLTEDIVTKNPNGPVADNNGGLLSLTSPDEIISELIANSLSKFDYELLKPNVSDKEIIILSADNEEARTAYFKALKEIAAQEFSSLPSQPEIDQFGIIAAAYGRTTKKLYNLPVPKSLAVLHKEEIRIFSAQAKIFSYIADYHNDPITALLSLQATELIAEELTALNDKFNSLIQ